MERIIGRGLTIIFFALIVFMGPPLLAQPEKIVLDLSKISGEITRPEVIFLHNRHMESDLSCKDCHHVYENGKNVLDESQLEEGNQGIHCSACHGRKSRLNLKEAYHHQCIGCHTKKKTGPRYCGECHIRNK